MENYDIYEEIKKLNLANIPRIYEIVKREDKLVVIEEYINGMSLKEILENYGPLVEEDVISYTLDLIDIVEGLYSGPSHIIHRDIKPSNIMINNDGILKLIDFDISRIHKMDKSTDTDILGTYGYAAPEQFGFNQSDIRTDIYSIGVTMNILLTGKLPLEEPYSGELARVISKCIELDPNRRFQNLGQLKVELIKRNGKKNIGDTSYNSLRIPGFKSNKPIFKILASIWYLFILMAGLGFFDQDPMTENRISNIVISFFLLSLTFLYGNYRDIKDKLPLMRSKNGLARLLAYFLYGFILLIISALLIP